MQYRFEVQNQYLQQGYVSFFEKKETKKLYFACGLSDAALS